MKSIITAILALFTLSAGAANFAPVEEFHLYMNMECNDGVNKGQIFIAYSKLSNGMIMHNRNEEKPEKILKIVGEKDVHVIAGNKSFKIGELEQSLSEQLAEQDARWGRRNSLCGTSAKRVKVNMTEQFFLGVDAKMIRKTCDSYYDAEVFKSKLFLVDTKTQNVLKLFNTHTYGGDGIDCRNLKTVAVDVLEWFLTPILFLFLCLG